MEKTIIIDGKKITFRASAAIPRLYRIKFGRDIFEDIRNIDKAMKSAREGENSTLPVSALTAFENTAYLMAKHADKDAVPEESVEEWLDKFETFSIYEIFPVIAELWGANSATLEKPKKK